MLPVVEPVAGLAGRQPAVEPVVVQLVVRLAERQPEQQQRRQQQQLVVVSVVAEDAPGTVVLQKYLTSVRREGSWKQRLKYKIMDYIFIL